MWCLRCVRFVVGLLLFVVCCLVLFDNCSIRVGWGVLCNSLFLYSWLIAYVNSAVVFQAYGCGFIVLSCLCCWCLHVAWTVLRTCRLFVFCVSVGWLDGLIVGVVYVVFAFRCFGCWLTYMLFVLVTFGCLLMFWFMDINSVVAIYYAWILWFCLLLL